MDIFPAHIAVLVSVEKYLVLAYQDYQQKASSIDSEPTLDFLDAKHIGVASLMFAVLERLLIDQSETEIDDVLYVLPHLLEVSYITEADLEPIQQTFNRMGEFNIFHEDASVRDFIAERAWWAVYKNYDYSPDSGLAQYITGLLSAYDLWLRYKMMCIEQDDS